METQFIHTVATIRTFKNWARTGIDRSEQTQAERTRRAPQGMPLWTEDQPCVRGAVKGQSCRRTSCCLYSPSNPQRTRVQECLQKNEQLKIILPQTLGLGYADTEGPSCST